MASSSFSLNSPVIERGPPNAVVYNLSEPDYVTIALPVGSTWSSGLHWHENHVEYLRVVRGTVRVTLGDQILTISAEDETTEVQIDRQVRHEWSRADKDTGEEVMVVERTNPNDGEKVVFFWNLNGVIVKAQSLACPPYMSERLHGVLVDFWVTLSLLAIFRDLDNVPVFVDILQAFSKRGFTFTSGTLGHVLLRGVDRFVAHIVLFVVCWVAWLCGIRSVRAEFTPEDVRRRRDTVRRADARSKAR